MITFAPRIIHREGDDRLPPGGKRAQAGCDLVAKAALMRRLRQVGIAASISARRRAPT